MKDEKYVCPASCSGSLDNFIRKIIHSPKKIFRNYIREGMTILDAGCGPGFFTIEFANMCGENGMVIAADLQEEMLDKVRKKITGKEIEKKITLHKCGKDKIGLGKKVDFVNAFYVVHEVPDTEKFLKEIYTLLNDGGILFLSEPKFHVSKKEFNETINLAIASGFKLKEQPKIYMSRTAVFEK
ncbi:MAG TPA: methyltransferase domain-containing protein [Ignavibacteria bacterium]